MTEGGNFFLMIAIVTLGTTIMLLFQWNHPVDEARRGARSGVFWTTLFGTLSAASWFSSKAVPVLVFTALVSLIYYFLPSKRR